MVSLALSTRGKCLGLVLRLLLIRPVAGLKARDDIEFHLEENRQGGAVNGPRPIPSFWTLNPIGMSCGGRKKSIVEIRCNAGGWSTAFVVSFMSNFTNVTTPLTSPPRRRTRSKRRAKDINNRAERLLSRVDLTPIRLPVAQLFPIVLPLLYHYGISCPRPGLESVAV